MPQANDGGPAAKPAAESAAKPAARATAKPAAARPLDPRSERDHKAISGLADDLLPALIAKLAASGLGEIEVREGAWKARLRKPAGADRAARAAETRLPHGHVPGRDPSHGRGAADERERRAREEESESSAGMPIVATSPAVGIYHPRKDLAVGMKVRAGDRLGAVDVLGVREDVVAPVDGVIGTSLVEVGEAVEYGQELIRIELPENARGLDSSGSDREAAAVLGEA
jgi:biotin carboxyl carrier protein